MKKLNTMSVKYSFNVNPSVELLTKNIVKKSDQISKKSLEDKKPPQAKKSHEVVRPNNKPNFTVQKIDTQQSADQEMQFNDPGLTPIQFLKSEVEAHG